MKQQAILHPNYEVISSIYRRHVIVEDIDLSAYLIVLFPYMHCRCGFIKILSRSCKHEYEFELFWLCCSCITPVHCVEAFALIVICSILFLLSQQSSERRNWVNSPELVAVTDSLLLSDSAHSPMFVWFFHYQSPFPLCFPFALLLFWSVIISLYPHNLFCCKSVQCPTLLCSFPVFPFKHGWMLPDICCAFLFNCDYEVSIWLNSQTCTLISGCI